jgi:hypothetical protein
MRTVGADIDALLSRQPLALTFPDGRGLRLRAGPPTLALLRAVAGTRGWSWGDRAALLAVATGWALKGFRCDPALTAAELCAGLPPRVRELLIDPLCVAALNTPARDASAAVLLRVLRDALFSGAGSADLLLPRAPLSALFPTPAVAWLSRTGAALRVGERVQTLVPAGPAWRVGGHRFDAVVLACSAAEAARLTQDIAPAWARRAAALRYEPIITVYLRQPEARLPTPMMALFEGPQAPAQFVFDHGALGGHPGVFAFVVSGAAAWVERGLEATAAAVQHQAAALLPQATVLRTLAEKRATFRCTPALDRPPTRVAPGLLAAGDYIEGPYPATLEGAVRAGEQAVAHLRPG